MKTPDQIPGMKTIGDFDSPNIADPYNYADLPEDFGGPHPVPEPGGGLVALIVIAFFAFCMGCLFGAILKGCL